MDTVVFIELAEQSHQPKTSREMSWCRDISSTKGQIGVFLNSWMPSWTREKSFLTMITLSVDHQKRTKEKIHSPFLILSYRKYEAPMFCLRQIKVMQYIPVNVF